MSLAKTPDSTLMPGAGSRRRALTSGLVAFAAAASAVGITAGAAASVADFVPSETADAALLTMCARAEEADRLMMEANRQQVLMQEEGRVAECKTARQQCDAYFDEFVYFAEKAAAIPALTVDGMRAKARLLYINAIAELEEGDLTSLILRDLGWGA